MLCPHGCGATFDEQRERAGFSGVTKIRETSQQWLTESWQCPSCGGATIDLVLCAARLDRDPMVGSRWRVEREDLRFRAWPRSSWIAPAEVPASIARDYSEAGAVLDISPRAAGVLARRCLQQVLVDHLGARPSANLHDQIEAVSASIPGHVASSLHAIREVGNFAAHPGKDQLSGDLIDVEDGEVEWTLTALQSLFDHVFVEPVRQAGRFAALNSKLTAAGKKALSAPSYAGPPVAASSPRRRQEPMPPKPPPAPPAGPGVPSAGPPR